MTEDDAIAWLLARYGDEAVVTLRRYVELLLHGTTSQNLIAPSTIAQVWSRHIVDSAQLVPLAAPTGRWLDIGSGAGLPGMVVGIVRPQPTLLIEPRKQRAAFLQECVAALNLPHVDVRCMRVEQLAEKVDVISARAVAPVEKLLHAAAACATPATRWLLPRGRSGRAEVAAVKRRWSGMFHMKQSLTDHESVILVLEGLHQR